MGYSIRFDDCFDAEKTRIKYVTDGVLLRETMSDPLLSRWVTLGLPQGHCCEVRRVLIRTPSYLGDTVCVCVCGCVCVCVLTYTRCYVCRQQRPCYDILIDYGRSYDSRSSRCVRSCM